MSYEFSNNGLLKLFAVKSLRMLGAKALVDPELGRDGTVASAPVEDRMLDDLLSLLARLHAIEELAERARAKAPELRRRLLAMAAQLEAQISADAWGSMTTSVVSRVPDQVIQSTAARSLLELSNRKVWAEMARELGIDPAEASRAYQAAGGESQYATMLFGHGVAALDLLNDRYHFPGMKAWIASATKRFTAAANQPYWRARTADLADAVAELVSGVRALKAMAG
jgi:hypothetical protein